MHGNWQAKLAGVVEFQLIHLWLDRTGAELPTPSHAECEQALVGKILPVFRKALDRSLIGRLRVGQSLRPAAGMAGANAGLAQRANISFGMRGAAYVVTP